MLWERAMPAISCMLSLKEKIAGMARSNNYYHMKPASSVNVSKSRLPLSTLINCLL